MLHGNASSYVCKNTLDDSLFNRCFLDHPPGPIHILGDTLQPWINPRALGTVAAFVVVGLPVVCSFSRSIRLSPAAYCAMKLSAINFLYRCSYALVLDVALYAVFQQRRPCTCAANGGSFTQVGSVYGMPSGDSMMGGLFGAFLWEAAGGSWAGRAIGAAVVVGAGAERVSWGMHSVGQASVGAGLGVLLHVWNTRTPQLMPLLETALLLPGGIALLLSDPNRKEWAIPAASQPGFQNNLLAWFLWGAALQVLAAVLLLRHYAALGIIARTRWTLSRYLRTLPLAPAPALNAPLLSNTDESQESRARSGGGSSGEEEGSQSGTGAHFCEATQGLAPELMLDLRFTLAAAAVCAQGLVVAAVEGQYAWIAQAGL